MKKHVSVLLIVLAFCLSLSAQDGRRIKVSCVGDSVTYGMKLADPSTESYPAQLQRLLGDGYEVGNFGKSGATLLRHGHRPYFEQEEFRRAMAFGGDIVIIHLGLNDTDPRSWPRYGDEFVGDYLALIDSLRSVNPAARFLLARMSPIGDTHSRFLTGTKAWHSEIQTRIEEVARLSGAQLIDFYEPLHRYLWMLPDSLHPTVEGAGFLARTAYQAVTGDYGGLSLPVWYSDNMVLPRRKVFSIKGIADAGAHVTVAIDGEETVMAEAVAGPDGRWSVSVGPFPATMSSTLTVTDSERELTFRNVAFGDIWLCSGQSNMEFELQQCSTASDALEASDPGLRLFDMKCLYRTDNVTWSSEAVRDVQYLSCFRSTAWEACIPSVAARFSAVGYYFGRALRESLDVPVGLICNAVGGSTTESWVSREMLETCFPEILADWLHNDRIMPWARQRAMTNLGLTESAGDDSRVRCSTAVYGVRHPYEPAYLWEAVILPLKDVPIRGVIWFQGESNAENIPVHERLFPLLVDSWRQVFGDVPFFYAQLSSMNRPTWPAFRASQTRLLTSRPGLGMVVTADLGEWNDVHFRSKKPVGERFARLALKRLGRK